MRRKTTPYNTQGNGQTERYNGIIWNTISLLLKSKNLPVTKWESVITPALHSIRSLLCTATNCTPHERLFSYNRKTSSGSCLPQWLTSFGSTVLFRRHERGSKYEPAVEKVELMNCNPQYAQIRLEGGRETTVSLRDLAPYADLPTDIPPDIPSDSHEINDSENVSSPEHAPIPGEVSGQHGIPMGDSGNLRRSGRTRVAPDRLGYT